MKIAVIVLSPRAKGTSTMLAQYIKGKLEKRGNTVEICLLYSYLEQEKLLLDKIAASDTIVMIGPCYITSYPAHTIWLLEKMASVKGVLHGQNLYGMIQGGMPYVHTHESGLRLLKVFSEGQQVTYKGGFVMGGGAMLNGRSLSHAINAKSVVPAVNEFIRKIGKNQAVERELYLNSEWRVQGVWAKLLAFLLTYRLKRSYRKKGINYKEESPYKRKTESE